MQPTGEQPNRPNSGRPPLSRQRSMDGVSPPIQRRPMQPMVRRPYVDTSQPSNQPQDQPAPIVDAPQPQQTEPFESAPQTPPQPAYSPPAEPVQPTEPIPTAVTTPNPEPQPYVPPVQQPAEPPQPNTEHIQQPQPASSQNSQAAPLPTTPVSHETPKPSKFSPPKQKKRRKIFMIIAIVAASLLVIAGIISIARAQAAWNNPDKAMKDAIYNNLSLKKVKSQTKSEAINSTTEYDFTSLKNPIISTESSIPQSNGPINMTGYGSVKSNYFSYSKLPSNLNSQGVKNAVNAVVQTRDDGKEFKGVDGMPKKVGDPRYQVISPLLLGNYDEKTRTQLTDFILNNKVYGYDINKVKTEKINDEDMLAYPIKINLSYLRVSNQSAVFNMGFDPAEIQLGIDNLGELEGAKVTIYISKSDHKFNRIKIEKDGQTKTIDYTNHDDLSMSDEPQTKLIWPNFEPVQNVIDAQTTLTTTEY